MRVGVFLLLGLGAKAEPFVMLMKSISREQGVYGEHIDVLLRVFNTGDSPAFGVSLKDDADWPARQFELVKGAKELSVPMLAVNASISHTFTVRPIFAGVFTPGAASVSYAPVEKGTILTHTSNALPPLLVLSRGDKYLNIALAIGRVLSLNFVRTLRGWLSLALFWISVAGLIGLFKFNQKRQAWRYERALNEIEKMK